jgi:hypothetical protein
MTILHLIHLNFQILSYTWYNSVESVNISPISSISQITEVFVFDTRFPPRPVICSDTNIGCDSDTNVFSPSIPLTDSVNRVLRKEERVNYSRE